MMMYNIQCVIIKFVMRRRSYASGTTVETPRLLLFACVGFPNFSHHGPSVSAVWVASLRPPTVAVHMGLTDPTFAAEPAMHVALFLWIC